MYKRIAALGQLVQLLAQTRDVYLDRMLALDAGRVPNEVVERIVRKNFFRIRGECGEDVEFDGGEVAEFIGICNHSLPRIDGKFSESENFELFGPAARFYAAAKPKPQLFQRVRLGKKIVASGHKSADALLFGGEVFDEQDGNGRFVAQFTADVEDADILQRAAEDYRV